MMSLVRELRLIPVVLFATVCLLALKVLGLVVDGGYTLGDIEFPPGPAESASTPLAAPDRLGLPRASEGTSTRAKTSWASEMFNFPDVTGTIANDKPDDKTGDKSGEKPVAKPAASAPATTPVITVAPGGVPVQLNASPVPPGERALLERLQERRQELDARARELEIRENLIKAAEKRLETRVGELKDLEARVKGAMAAKDEADAARFKSLVTMYENMKAKDAAKIFDRLEMRILLEVATQINPRRMSDILAQMQPESAEKLTIELANRATGTAPAPPPVELPKIEGRPKAP